MNAAMKNSDCCMLLLVDSRSTQSTVSISKNIKQNWESKYSSRSRSTQLHYGRSTSASAVNSTKKSWQSISFVAVSFRIASHTCLRT